MGLLDDDHKRRQDLARYDEARRRAEYERNARRLTEHQRAQGVGNASRGGRSCSVVLLLMLAATAGIANAIRSVATMSEPDIERSVDYMRDYLRERQDSTDEAGDE